MTMRQGKTLPAYKDALASYDNGTYDASRPTTEVPGILQALRRRHSGKAQHWRSSTPRIIVGTTHWTLNGVNIFSANFVRSLRAQGHAAHILLTEEFSVWSQILEARMPRPDDIPFVTLPVGQRTSWGGHWGAMLRYLEERAPCIYIPNYDWRHSCVSPLLSAGVGIVGIIHSDDPLHYDHVARLGRYWQAAVAVSQTIAEKILLHQPDLAERTHVIPIGVHIPHSSPTFAGRPGTPLRVIYHGTLKQHQKRIFDLPDIIAAAAQQRLPVELTIAGGGPDATRVRELSQPLVEQGRIHFLGVVPHDKILALLAQHDVYLLASEFEGMPNALLEAMGQGCVPLVTRMESGVPEVVRDGDNGCVVPIGDIAAFVERLRWLQSDPQRRHSMAQRAYDTVAAGSFRVQDMVQAYLSLFEQIFKEMRDGTWQRPLGSLQPPPAQVAGINLFPVAMHYTAPGVGVFPSYDPDYREFAAQLRSLAPGRMTLSG